MIYADSREAVDRAHRLPAQVAAALQGRGQFAGRGGEELFTFLQFLFLVAEPVI
jgi:hypothetical protein